MKFLKNRTVLGIICIALSLIICFGITPLYSRSLSAKTEVVQVTEDIHVGDTITDQMVTSVGVGKRNLPANMIHETTTAVGKYATADLHPGDFILSTKLSEKPTRDSAYLSRLNGTKQAISVTVKSFAAGLSGKLQAGDVVEVIAPDFRKTGETIIPQELQFVEVIAVTSGSGFDANTGEAIDNREKELPATATLLVTTEQAKLLAELEACGNLHLSLVYRGTPDRAKEFLMAQDEVLEVLHSPVESEVD